MSLGLKQGEWVTVTLKSGERCAGRVDRVWLANGGNEILTLRLMGRTREIPLLSIATWRSLEEE